MAKKVENLEEYERLRDLGYEFFQGYLLSRPRTLHTRTLSPAKHAVIVLLSRLFDPASEVHDLEAALALDPTLSYKLIRLINSAFFSPPREIRSLKDAIVMLGRKKLAAWATLIALNQAGDQPQERIRIALARAKMCEILAERIGLQGSDGFVVGLFSSLDILLDRPLRSVLKPLPLAEGVKDAILLHQGQLGRILATVLDYEFGRLPQSESLILDMDTLREANLDALEWARSATGMVGAR